jgi:hypothetical protein
MVFDTRHARTLVLLLAALFLATPSWAQNWDELIEGGGDAGDDLVGAHDLTGLSYTTISGQIANFNDVDIYKLNIMNAANFSATTVQISYTGGDVLDSWLYLFDASGNAVYSNSESPAGDPGNPSPFANALLPKVGDVGLNPSGLGPASDGIYYLAVTHWENMALDSGSNDMFEDPFDFSEDYERINAPIGGAGVLDSWSNDGSDAGNYVVSITGTSLPVELTSLNAVVDGGDIILRWQTISETDNAGFEVEVARGEGAFTDAGFTPGAGTTNEPQKYSFRLNATFGVNRLRLRQINRDGSSSYSQIVEAAVGITGLHDISRAYPNPFTSMSAMDLSVPEAQEVQVDLYSVLGQRISTLFRGYMNTNSTETVVIDGSNLPTGFYVVKVSGERFTDSQLVTLVR